MKHKKSFIRKTSLERRLLLDEEELRLKSKQIAENLMNLEIFEKSGVIMCYMDFRNEVQTCGIINRCQVLGKTVALPLVERCPGKQLEIAAYVIRDVKTDLEMGAYGILEPDPNSSKRLDPAVIDMVIVPGVAFDAGKNRIGYGAGCYDRFLKKVRGDCVKVGLAFEVQMVDRIPAEDDDVQMDIVITEKRVII